jgi:hypothetical protein
MRIALPETLTEQIDQTEASIIGGCGLENETLLMH